MRGSVRSSSSRWHALGTRPASLTTDELLRLVRDVTDEGGSLWIGAQGPSMSPTIRAGDHVLLVPAPRVRAGDVVLADVHGRGVLHRVLRADADAVQTAGDGVLAPDAPLLRSRIVARALARERDGTVTALAWEPALGAMPLVRGAWWRTRLALAHRARRMRARLSRPS